MVDWKDDKKTGFSTAVEALEKIKNSKEGETGAIELEGDEAMKMLQTLFTNSEDVTEKPGIMDELPEPLRKIIEGVGGMGMVAGIKVVKIAKDELPDLDQESMQEVLDHHENTRAEDDDRWWDTQRDFPGGVEASYREIRDNAQKLVDKDESARATQIGNVILGLLDDLVESSDLMREGQKLIRKQAVLLEESKAHLENYRTHMIVEHGVVPDDL